MRNKALWSPKFLWSLALALTVAWSGCGDRKIGSHEKQKARQAMAKLDKLKGKYKDTEKRLMAMIEEDKALMSKARVVTVAQKKLKELRAKIDKLKAQGKELTKLVEKNKYKDAKKVHRLAWDIDRKVNRLSLRLALAINPVRELRDAKKNAKKLVKQVARDAKTAQGFPTPALKKAAKKAAKKYPKAKAGIDARIAAMGPGGLAAKVAKFDAATKKSPPDYLAMGRHARAVRLHVAGLETRGRDLARHLEELAFDVDLILVDMKEDRGKYYHQYQRIVGPKSKRTGWVKVTPTYFRLHTDHLGMSLHSKPEGVFHDDAVVLATPPGYVYLDNKKYGKWKPDGSGKRHWKYHKKYGYMQTLFFAAGLVATYAAYKMFRKYRKKRMVFYGLAGAVLYGTRSGRMRKRYGHYYKRRAGKLKARRVRRARRSGSSRTGRSGRSSRRSGK